MIKTVKPKNLINKIERIGSVDGMQQFIVNGVPWFDQNNNPVNAHGACILQENNLFYLFGEYKRDDKNSYNGFSCYSSTDLIQWQFEGMSLVENADERLNGNRIGERVKVVKSNKSKKYVMLMHTDDLKYNDPCICLAISDKITGEYEFIGPLLYQGTPIRKWDMGTFTEDDGTVYLLTHEGYIYRLNEECTEAVELIVSEIAPGGESPAMCKWMDIYYLVFSNKTSWERNDNYYLTAKSLYGPWENQGLFCKEGSLTYNTQSSFLLKLTMGEDERVIYLGDRWSFPRQGSAATLVLLPVEFIDEKMQISSYQEVWNLEMEKPECKIDEISFCSDMEGESFVAPFEGDHILVFGKSSFTGGYAKIEIENRQGESIHCATIDFYSAVQMEGIRYCSPKFPKGAYQIRVTVLGEAGEWFKKDGTRFGSEGCLVEITGVGKIV